jgi:hypothetical protein
VATRAAMMRAVPLMRRNKVPPEPMSLSAMNRRANQRSTYLAVLRGT